MASTLERLYKNSQAAIDDGIYDVSVHMPQSDYNLCDIIRTHPHATLITEIKFSSPSMGRIRTPSDPAVIARQMVQGGARAISVLTQPHLFGGSPEYLVRVREAVNVPILMKDIIIDRVQIDAGRLIGADYILLICSLFDQGYMNDIDAMIQYAHDSGLRVLLEAHTREELVCALDTDADLVGINNRNLDTLQVDSDTTCRILDGIQKTCPIVSESGISTPADILRLRACGADAFLVGSSIMQGGSIADDVQRLAGAY